MTNVEKIALSVAIIAVISFLQCCVNFKKNRRVRQCPLAIIILLAMIAGVYALIQYSPRIEPILTYYGLNEITLLLYNLALLIAAVLIKLLLLLPLGLIGKKQAVLRLFSLSFYEYDEDLGEWS